MLFVVYGTSRGQEITYIHFSKKTNYRKFPKYSDTQNIVVMTLKFEQCGSTIE